MKLYKALYKCRYCGDVYYNAVISDGDATMAMRNLNKQDFYYPAGSTFGAYRHNTHYCANGALGFSDVIALEPYDTDEQKLS